MVNFDNTTLKEAVDNNLVSADNIDQAPTTVHLSSTELAKIPGRSIQPETTTQPQTEQGHTDNSRPEKRTRKGLLIGGGAAAATLAIGLSINAINSAGEDEPLPDPNPVAEQPDGELPMEAPGTDNEVSPTDIPEDLIPVEEPTSEVESEPVSSTIEWLESVPTEEFQQLSRENRLTYVEYILEQHNKGAHGYLTPKTDASYNPVNIASIDNTGEEILKQSQYLYETAYLQRDPSQVPVDVSDIDPATLMQMDKTRAQKVVDSIYYYTRADGEVLDVYLQKTETINNADSVINLNLNEQVVLGETEVFQDTDRYGNPIDVKSVEVQTLANGTEHVYVHDYIYQRFVNDAGEESGMWLLYQVRLP